jgi:putative membrane protein
VIRPALLVIAATLLALAVISSGLLPGITIQGKVELTLLAAAGVLAVLNALVRPVLRLFTCPLVLLLSAFVLFVFNGLALLVTAWVSEALAPYTGGRLIVTSIGWAVAGGLIVSVVVTLVTAAQEWWSGRVTVTPPPKAREIAQAQRAQLDEEFDAMLQAPPPAPDEPPSPPPPGIT